MHLTTSMITSCDKSDVLKNYAKSSSRLGAMVGMSAGGTATGTELSCAAFMML